VVVIRELHEVLPRQHEHAGVVPTFQRADDLLLLTFASRHGRRTSCRQYPARR
jgi:hypothetical protein